VSGERFTQRIALIDLRSLQSNASEDALIERKDILDILLVYRGIDEDDICPECDGFGKKTYASTATWSGGVGGSSLTMSVCDKCWGSGTKLPWRSWREIQGTIRNLQRQIEEAKQREADTATAEQMPPA
jgi:hypothetical protein